jgi:ATP-dependent Clp protease protease subunit
MIHQPLGGATGQATDISIQANEILAIKKKMTELLSEKTGQSFEKIAEDIDRDFFLTAEEALEYGIVDQIVPAAKKGEE